MSLSDNVVWWLVAASVAMFLISLLAVPAIIIRLPVDYFCHERRRRAPPSGWRLPIYYSWLVAKNLAGCVFVMMGLAMLVLPGQGVLSILLGLSLINFPGKYQLEQYIVTRAPVRKSINWIRRKAHKPPLRLDP